MNTYDGFNDLSTTGIFGFAIASSVAISAKFGVDSERLRDDVVLAVSAGTGGIGAFLFCLSAASLSLSA